MPDITLYTTPGCSACAAVKRYLDAKELPYEEKDVTADPAWLDEMKAVSGVRIAPVTVIDGHAIYGTFDQQRPRIDAALVRAEDPRASA